MKRRELFQKSIDRIKNLFSSIEQNENGMNNDPDTTDDQHNIELKDAILTDFKKPELMHELMKLGIDPSNYTKDEMIDVVIAEMKKRKPQTLK